jgi:hypothetical protein
MSLEHQIEKLNANLEKVISLLSTGLNPTEAAIPESIKKPKAEPAKPEPAKAEPVPVQESKVTLKDIQDRVKILAATIGRDALIALFEAWGMSKLSELPEDRYVEIDLALAKAINKAKGE